MDKKTFADYLQTNDWDNLYSASLEDATVRKDLLDYLARNPVIQRVFALRTNFLNDKGVSFDEHFKNLKLKFPEYDWTPVAENKTFQIARIIKEMLNFELQETTKGIIENERKETGTDSEGQKTVSNQKAKARKVS